MEPLAPWDLPLESHFGPAWCYLGVRLERKLQGLRLSRKARSVSLLIVLLPE
jgi:hypothetical protein